MNAIDQVYKAANGPANLARDLGIRINVVTNWRLRGTIPADQCPGVERATGVKCEVLRPDITWTRDTSGQVTGYHVPISSN